MNKVKISLLFIFCLVLFGGCVSKEKLKLKESYIDKEVLVEYGEIPSLEIKDYLVEETSEELLSNTTINIYDEIENEPINTEEILPIGEYRLVISTNEENDEQSVEIKVMVKDTIAPEFVDFSEELSFTEGEDVDLTQIFKISDLSEASIHVEGELDFSIPNEYNVKFIAQDTSGNKTEKDCVIHINSKPEEVKPSIPSSNSKPSEDTNTTNENIPAKPSENVSKPSYKPNYAQEVLNLVNQERANAGLSPVQWNSVLANAADIRSKELVSSFSHTRPDGSDCFSAISSNSFMTLGENIAQGSANFMTPSVVMNGWMNSPGHRANILNPDFIYLGISCYLDENGILQWVQIFGG